MNQDINVDADDDSLNEAGSFHFDPDSDDHLSLDSSTQQELTPNKMSKYNKFLHPTNPWNEELQDNSQIIYSSGNRRPYVSGNPSDPTLSAIPEEYQPRNQNRLMNMPMLRLNTDWDDDAATSGPSSPMFEEDDMSLPSPNLNQNITLYLKPVDTLGQEDWDEKWPEAAPDDVDSEEHEEPPCRFQCATDHYLCLRHHGPPWVYSDDEGDSDHTISDSSDSEDIPNISSSLRKLLKDISDSLAAARLNASPYEKMCLTIDTINALHEINKAIEADLEENNS